MKNTTDQQSMVYVPAEIETFSGPAGVAVYFSKRPDQPGIMMPISHECAAGLIKHLVKALSKSAPQLLLSMADES